MNISDEEYEQMVLDQENRKFWDCSTRYTTIQMYPYRITYKEFLDMIQNWGVQENLQSGKMFVEEWMEMFCAYHEIEYDDNPNIGELKYRNTCIDNAIKTQLHQRKYKNDI